MNTKYYCHNCGKLVSAVSSTCPYCGISFSAVKCPQCGFEGKEDLFKDGCPSCGFLSIKSTTKKIETEKKITIPLKIYILVILLFVGIIIWFLTLILK